ncbi:hypothetical protein [Nocardia asiatica]|uniref:hypothetical protein n=1 Tax=Nocardia asiatica TaxID=209252 RepID=UPI0012F79D85|nr:hypothetical protein [Nocardia asiatica]
MSLSVEPDNTQSYPVDPKGPEIHPLVVLSLALTLALAAGLLVGWPAGVSVFVTVLGLFVRTRSGPTE